MLIFGTPFLYVMKAQFQFRSNFLHKAAKNFHLYGWRFFGVLFWFLQVRKIFPHSFLHNVQSHSSVSPCSDSNRESVG